MELFRDDEQWWSMQRHEHGYCPPPTTCPSSGTRLRMFWYNVLGKSLLVCEEIKVRSLSCPNFWRIFQSTGQFTCRRTAAWNEPKLGVKTRVNVNHITVNQCHWHSVELRWSFLGCRYAWQQTYSLSVSSSAPVHMPLITLLESRNAWVYERDG